MGHKEKEENHQERRQGSGEAEQGDEDQQTGGAWSGHTEPHYFETPTELIRKQKPNPEANETTRELGAQSIRIFHDMENYL